MLEIALSQYGVKEISGDENNMTIVNYFQEIGFEHITTEDTAWCSCFAIWCAMKSRLEHSDSLLARSWMDIGKEIPIPFVGCIVVLWRVSKDSIYGHVGIFIREGTHNVYILGGNQDNQVNITSYPKHRVLGYRKLSLIPLEDFTKEKPLPSTNN